MSVKSRYKTVALNTNGASYASRSVPLSAQRSLNIYPEVTPQGISPTVMFTWPGSSTVALNATLPGMRGLYAWQGDVYGVSGSDFVKFDGNNLGSYTIVGTIPVNGFQRASMSDNGEVIIICAGDTPYQYDGTNLTAIGGVTANPTKVQFLNERFYINGDDGGVTVSDVLSTNFDNANVFYGRSTPEPTVTHYIFNQIIYLFDPDSVEPWQDVSTGAPPVGRINQGIIEGVGCSSINGVTSTDSYMYFIGTDGHAYRVNGFSAQDITNTVIAGHFRGLNVANVILESISMQGDKFIIFNFLDDDETWVYSEGSSSWFEIGVDGFGYPISSFVFFGGRWLGGLNSALGIFELSPDTVINANQPLIRERIISTVSGDDIGEPGVMLEMSKIRFSMETGMAIDSFNFRSPEVMIIPSFDGGYTFGKPIFLDLGESGDFTLPVELHMMQQFRRAVFKIRLTDFYGRFTIFSASIDVRKAGY